jgi:CheY-like chemotaxis protein
MEDKKKLVLIVEDDEAIAVTEKNILEKNGFSVIIFNNGEEAVNEVSRNKDIDIIIIDLEIGNNGVNGVKTSELILQQRNIPIIFCIGNNEERYIEK